MESTAEFTSIDTLPREEKQSEVLTKALASTENYLLRRAPQQSFGEILLGFYADAILWKKDKNVWLLLLKENAKLHQYIFFHQYCLNFHRFQLQH